MAKMAVLQLCLVSLLIMPSLASILTNCQSTLTTTANNSTGQPIQAPAALLSIEECHTVSYTTTGSGYIMTVTLAISHQTTSSQSAIDMVLDSTLLSSFNATLLSLTSDSLTAVLYQNHSSLQTTVAEVHSLTLGESITINCSIAIINAISRLQLVSSLFSLRWLSPDPAFSALQFSQTLYYATNLAPIIRGPTSYTLSESVVTSLSLITFTDADFGTYTSGGSILFSITSDSPNTCSFCLSRTISRPLLVTIGDDGIGGINPKGAASVTAEGPFSVVQKSLSTLTAFVSAHTPSLITVTLLINDRGNSGVGGEKIANKTIQLNIFPAALAAPAWKLPSSLTGFEFIPMSLASLSLVNPAALTSNYILSMAVSSDLNFTLTPGTLPNNVVLLYQSQSSTFCGTVVSMFTPMALPVPATSCLSLNGTLSSLNDSFVALGVQPPWLFNTIRDGAALLSLTLVADSVSTAVVSATVDLLFLSVNQAPVISVPSTLVSGSMVIPQTQPAFLTGIVILDEDLLETYDSDLYVELSVIPAEAGTIALNSTFGIAFSIPSPNSLTADQLLHVAYGEGLSTAMFPGDALSVWTVPMLGFSGDEQALSWAMTAGIRFTPSPIWSGNATLSISVLDRGLTGHLESRIWTNTSFILQVVAKNQPPLLFGPFESVQPLILAEDSAYFLNLSFSDWDSIDQLFSIQLSALHGFVSLSTSTLLSSVTSFSASSGSLYNSSFSGIGESFISIIGSFSNCSALIANLSFTPALHYSGVNAALNINITDSGGLSTWATYRFLVYDVPDLPVLTLTSNSVSVPIGSPLSLGQILFISDPDASWQHTIIAVNFSVTNGTLLFRVGAEGQGLHYARGNGINNTIIELRGESALLSLSLSTLVYYPSIGYTESDTLVVSVAELEFGVMSPIQTASLHIIVLRVDRPLTLDLPYGFNGLEDTMLQLTPLNLSSIDQLYVNVTVSLTVQYGTLLFTDASAVTLSQTVSASGLRSTTLFGWYSSVVALLYSGVTYQPDPNYNLDCCNEDLLQMSAGFIDQFGVMLWNDNLEVPIRILPMNDAPTIRLQSALITDENTELRLSAVLIDDIDVGEQFDGLLTVRLQTTVGCLRCYDLGGCSLLNGTFPFVYTQARLTVQSDRISGGNGDTGRDSDLLPSTLGDVDLRVSCTFASLALFLASTGYIPSRAYFGSDNLTISVSDNGINGNGTVLNTILIAPITINYLGIFPPQITFISNHSYLFIMEDSPTMMSLHVSTTGASFTPYFIITIASQIGLLSFVNISLSTITAAIMLNESVLFDASRQSSVTGLASTTQYQLLTLWISNTTINEEFDMSFVYAPLGQWNSVRRGPDLVGAFAKTLSTHQTIVLPISPFETQWESHVTRALLSVIVLAVNDVPVVQVPSSPQSINEMESHYFGEFGDLDPNGFLVADADSHEAELDALLYFELSTGSETSRLVLNTTDGIHMLSDHANPINELTANNVSAINTDPVAVTRLMIEGASFLSGYADPALLTRSLRGLRYVAGAGLSTDYVRLAVSDRGRVTSCLNPILELVNAASTATQPSTIAVSLSATMALTASLLGTRFIDALSAASIAENQPLEGSMLDETTTPCSVTPWTWTNRTITINVLGINQPPSLIFVIAPSAWIPTPYFLQPTLVPLSEDTAFVLPRLILGDREITLCNNDVGYIGNFTILLSAVRGVLWFSPSLEFASNSTAWMTLLSVCGHESYGSINSSLITISCSIAQCQTVLDRTVYIPNSDYNGPEGVLSVMVTDDGGCSRFLSNPASSPQSAIVELDFVVLPVNDLPIISVGMIVDGIVQRINSSPENSRAQFELQQNTALIFTGATELRVSDQDVDETYGALLLVVLKVTSGTLQFSELVSQPWLAAFTPYIPGVHWVDNITPPAATLQFWATQTNLALALGGGLLYKPRQHFCGNDSLIVLVSDSGQTGSGVLANVTLIIDMIVSCIDTPLTLDTPTSFTGIEDTPFSLVQLVLSSVDTLVLVNVTVEAKVITGTLALRSFSDALSIFGNNTHYLLFSGALSALASQLANNLVYIPSPNFNGWDELSMLASFPAQYDFPVTVGAGVVTAADSVMPIWIAAVNDAPQIRLPVSTSAGPTPMTLVPASASPTVWAQLRVGFVSFTTQQDSGPFYLQDIVSIFDVDVDEPVTLGWSLLRLNLTCSFCALDLASYAGLAIISGDASLGAVIIEAGLTHLNAALSRISYTPTAGFYGDDILYLEVNDLGYTGSGNPRDPTTRVPLYDTAMLRITVTSINTLPELPSYPDMSISEDTALFLPALRFKHYNHPPLESLGYIVALTVQHGQLVNSTGDLTFTQSVVKSADVGITVLKNGSDGQIIVQSTGGNLTAVFALFANLTYLPELNYNGLDTLQMIVTDLTDSTSSQNATIDITITSVNDAPVLTWVNSSQAIMNVIHDVLTPLPIALLADVDADDSTQPMSLSVSAIYGMVALTGPYGAQFLDSTGRSAIEFGSTLRISGSLHQLSVCLTLLQYRSPAIVQASDPIDQPQMHPYLDLGHLSIQWLYPIYTNDTVAISVNDQGATGAENTNIISQTLNVSITLVASQSAPLIVSTFDTPLTMLEDELFIFNTSQLYLVSSELSYTSAAVLKLTVLISSDAATVGIAMLFDALRCPTFAVTTATPGMASTNQISGSKASLLDQPVLASLHDSALVTRGSPIMLLPGFAYIFQVASLETLNLCLGNMTVLPPLEHRSGSFESVLTFVVERMDTMQLSGFNENFGATVSSQSLSLDLVYLEVNTAPVITTAAANILTIVGSTTPVPSITVNDIDFSHMTFPFGEVQVTVSVANGTLSMLAVSVIDLLTPIETFTQLMFAFKGALPAVNQALASLFYLAPAAPIPPTGLQLCFNDQLLVEVNDLGNFGKGDSLNTTLVVPIIIYCFE